jgi:murein DD-endopeptidase MepM/ murein hydrolase activator NlpD
MFVAPLKRMKLRTKQLDSPFAASYGRVRNWNASSRKYSKFHQGWDLEAADGTPCYAISGGVVTHVGHHPQFGLNVVLAFSRSGQADVSAVDSLWAFYAHLSHVFVTVNQIVKASDQIGLTGHTGNASASAPHLHFEVRNVPSPSPGLGNSGRLDPALILGQQYLVCS